MPILRAKGHSNIACDGQTPRSGFPFCDVGFYNPTYSEEEMIEKALDSGWIRDGELWLCPKCAGGGKASG